MEVVLNAGRRRGRQNGWWRGKSRSHSQQRGIKGSLRTVGAVGIGVPMSIIASQAALNRGGRRCWPIRSEGRVSDKIVKPGGIPYPGFDAVIVMVIVADWEECVQRELAKQRKGTH